MEYLDFNIGALVLIFASLVISAVLAIVVRDLLKAAIALGLTSAILTIVMFLMDAYLAAAFELSVCAGLITVVFISSISLTNKKTEKEIVKLKKLRIKRFSALPIVLVIAAVIMFIFRDSFNIDWVLHAKNSKEIVQEVIWNVRQVDVLGQIIIILAGVFGVSILFKESGIK